MVLPKCILVGTFRSLVLFERAAGQVNLYVPLFLGQEHSVQCRASHGFREWVIPSVGEISSQAFSSMIGWH